MTYTHEQITFSRIVEKYGETPSQLIEYWHMGKGWVACQKTATTSLIAKLATEGATRFCFQVGKTPRTDFGIKELTC